RSRKTDEEIEVQRKADRSDLERRRSRVTGGRDPHIFSTLSQVRDLSWAWLTSSGWASNDVFPIFEHSLGERGQLFAIED
ncbi:MAG: hypothetical protein H0U23_12340, partial [Blastocatellia bacterium]|nr:hypothetical protein [Blastocatellia bacterium]